MYSNKSDESNSSLCGSSVLIKHLGVSPRLKVLKYYRHHYYFNGAQLIVCTPVLGLRMRWAAGGGRKEAGKRIVRRRAEELLKYA